MRFIDPEQLKLIKGANRRMSHGDQILLQNELGLLFTNADKLNELAQDAIQALGADLETGNHHGNNAAASKFAIDHPRFSAAFNLLVQACSQNQDGEDL